MAQFPSHRRDIVEKIADRLRSENVTDAVAIFKNPFREIDADEELPCLKIGIIRDPATWRNNAIEYSHKPEIVVAYVDKGNDELADKLYYMAERIENFLINDENMQSYAGLFDTLELQGMDMQLSNAETGLGAIVLKFTGEYITRHEPVLPDFAGLEIEVSSGAADPGEAPAFVESITLPAT